ncbi:hypothetical protein QE375_002899 [Microbacterium foliorum]|uniref:DUF3027 domain-containing protein n=1 Tax=Microbacterium foliorum TaxID=104336 RepID=A0ABU1HTG7_9MICO|nr:DUF6527 family protein [Microbacterium foliorum]MDR6143345.1 hypothetical protein [Microbacterium foliorum]
MTDVFVPFFVDEIPEALRPDGLYVCIPYATAVHLCACGCGNEVVTPLTPVDWRLTFDGRVSLSPSIGNWSFACRSHYWITDERVHWSSGWDDERIERNRARDRQAKAQHFADAAEASESSHRKKLPWWRLRRTKD